MTSFIKYNYKNNDTFIKEANNLRQLHEYLDPDYLKVPEVINVSRQALELQRVILSRPTPELMSKFGIGLAKLHQKKFPQYGFEEHNFIGLNVQKNELCDNWGEFFFSFRLLFQVQLIQSSSLRHQFEEILNSKKEKIIAFLNANCEHASFVHGDLWSGNVVFDKETPWLVDPSSYYGDREVDIAMTELFSGFSDEFYDSYNRTYALSSEYERKKVIYNLYHLLNHYNLFGQAYFKECEKGFNFLTTL